MTNREYLRNLLAGITAELAAIKPDEDTPNFDFHTLESAILNAIRETEALDPDAIDEAYQVKALYDRLKAVVVHERILRNTLDRIATASQACLEACNRISEQVEQDTPPEDDAL